MSFRSYSNSTAQSAIIPCNTYRDLKTKKIWSVIPDSVFFILRWDNTIRVYVDMTPFCYIQNCSTPVKMDAHYTTSFYKVLIHANGLVQAELTYPLFVDHNKRVFLKRNKAKRVIEPLCNYKNITDFFDEDLIEQFYNTYYKGGVGGNVL